MTLFVFLSVWLLCVSWAPLASAQDPAQGWLSYAIGVNPSGTGIITKAEAKWRVGAMPAVGGAFYSPWLGVETSDNLNLIQPVNPFDGMRRVHRSLSSHPLRHEHLGFRCCCQHFFVHLPNEFFLFFFSSRQPVAHV